MLQTYGRSKRIRSEDPEDDEVHTSCLYSTTAYYLLVYLPSDLLEFRLLSTTSPTQACPCHLSQSLPEAVSARIMQEARRQQEEVEAEGDPLRQQAAAAGGR